MGIGLPKKMMMMIWQTHCVEGKTSVNNIVNLLHRAELHYRQAPDPLGHLLVVVDNLHQAQLLHLPPEASLPVNKHPCTTVWLPKTSFKALIVPISWSSSQYSGLMSTEASWKASNIKHGSRFAFHRGEERRQLEWHTSLPCSWWSSTSTAQTSWRLIFQMFCHQIKKVAIPDGDEKPRT